MTWEIEYAYACHIGKVRTNNEDNFWCCGHFLPVKNRGLAAAAGRTCSSSELPVLAVFDGMGGESCGEIAAGLAAEGFDRYYQKNKYKLRRDGHAFVQEACREMNEAVCTYGRDNHIRTMGTTLAMLAFGGESIYACNLGDSRIYQARGDAFMRVSTDHVLGGGIFGKAPLTRYLGALEEELEPEPAVARLPYREDTRYLICSDGVTDMLTDVEIGHILSGDKKPREIIEALLEKALQKGGRDNVTAILCRTGRCRQENPFVRWLKKRLHITGRTS